MLTMRGCVVTPVDPNFNYLIADTLCNAFVAGELGSRDDFFLMGSQPQTGTEYPLLTGNLLDSDGRLLCRIVQNAIVNNPGKCRKIVGNQIGYEIHDGSGSTILKVETTFERVTNVSVNGEMHITRLTGTFYNKSGKAVFSTDNTEEAGKLLGESKIAMGLNGNSLGLSRNMSSEENESAVLALFSKGQIYEPVRGKIEDKEVLVDGKIFINAELNRCTLVIDTGAFAQIGPNVFKDCKVTTRGNALQLMRIYEGLSGTKLAVESQT